MDIIVIGDGIGGIASAARLARAGHHVTVLAKGPGPVGLASVRWANSAVSLASGSRSRRGTM